MHTLNIKVNNIQGQTKPVHDLYKDSLDDIMDSKIDNIMAKIV